MIRANTLDRLIGATDLGMGTNLNMEFEHQLIVKEETTYLALETDIKEEIQDTSTEVHIKYDPDYEPDSSRIIEEPKPAKLEKRHAYDISNESFAYSSQLQRHKNRHVGGPINQFPCDICGKGFANPSALKRHKYRHLGLKPFPCDICGKAFSEQSILRKHKIRHAGFKPFVCDICEKTFADQSQLTIHRNRHLKLRPFSCTMCKKSFKSPGNFSRHMKRHSQSKPLACDFCNKTFSAMENLHRHNINRHLCEPWFSCDYCGKSYKTSCERSQHITDHQDAELAKKLTNTILISILKNKVKETTNTYQVNAKETEIEMNPNRKTQVVVKELPSQTYLNTDIKEKIDDEQVQCSENHVMYGPDYKPSPEYSKYVETPAESIKEDDKQLETENLNAEDKPRHACKTCSKSVVCSCRLPVLKPFFCDICGKSYANIHSLKTHKSKIHNVGDKPFSCDICDKIYTNDYALQIHKNRHLGLKPFSCQICTQSFANQYTLKRHMNKHFDINPFVCNICEKTFTYASSLRNHRNTHSQVKPFACDFCNKTFSDMDCLQRHNSFMHLCEPWFSCDVCGKSFKTTCELAEHATNEHSRV